MTPEDQKVHKQEKSRDNDRQDAPYIYFQTRGVARGRGGGLRGLEHPPLSSAIVGGAIQHNIILYIMH